MTIWEEDGGVFVSTNSSMPPSLNLPLGRGLSPAMWPTPGQQETVDLTPWVGKTIQVVFYYQAYPYGDEIYGWTIDDISITGVAAGGNVSITKNLGQGTWSLSSLSSIGLVPVQSGVAPSVTISNLAAGQYVVQFGDVPYYQTPADQTNTLAVGGTVNFTGNYTFLDVNHNGISDAWEMDLLRLRHHQPDAVHRHGRRRDVGLRRVHRRDQSDQRRFQTGFPLRHGAEQPVRPTAMGGHSRPDLSGPVLDQHCFLGATHRLDCKPQTARCPTPQPTSTPMAMPTCSGCKCQP